MANRGLNNPVLIKPDAVANTGSDELAQGIAEGGEQIIKSSQQALMMKQFSQAQIDLNAEKEQYQLKYQDNPFEGVKQWTDKRDEIMGNYGDNVSPFFRGEWNQQTRDFGVRDDYFMQQWAYSQAAKNTTKDISSTMQSDYLQANQDGINYGQGKTDSAGALLNFTNRQNNLATFAAGNLGHDVASGLLKNYTTDSTKMFVAGVAQTSPQKAAELLNSDVFKSKFTTEQLGEMGDLIQKTQKQQDLIKGLQNTMTTQQVTDTINDESQSYAQRRLTIDKAEQQGSLTAPAAANARRVLTSSQSVDAVTDTPTMSGIISRVYDMNAQQGLSGEDYLTGMKNINEQILTAQADGKLNANDVVKLNNEIKTLTANKVSKSTQEVGSSMYDATQKFDQLPPEWRGEATRQLFYATQGKSATMSGDAYNTLMSNSAQTVIDGINSQRRANAVKQLQQPQEADVQQKLDQQTDFMDKHGITLQQIEETAKNRNMTNDEVYKKLRDHFGE